jgi:hypothetical protein
MRAGEVFVRRQLAFKYGSAAQQAKDEEAEKAELPQELAVSSQATSSGSAAAPSPANPFASVSSCVFGVQPQVPHLPGHLAVAEPAPLVQSKSKKRKTMAMAVSEKHLPGFVPVRVNYAPVENWRQMTVYVSPQCNSNDLTRALRQHVGGSANALRVHEGFRGHPYDSVTPLTHGPGSQRWIVPLGTPYLVVPSFCPDTLTWT